MVDSIKENEAVLPLQEMVTALYDSGAEAVPEIVDTIINEGIRRGASDIHLIPEAGGINVKFRLDGVMQEILKLPGLLQDNVVSRCKVMGGLMTYRNDIPQEGSGSSPRFGEGLEYRISTFPAHKGERVTVRIFDNRRSCRSVGELGLDENVSMRLQNKLMGPEGLVFLSGPCGSGKTTTLYACLKFIVNSSSGGRSVVTVEDPVENEIAGVTQTAVRRAVGLDYVCALRSLLRQDPEVIMVGEVRDAETAHAAVEAALTGHLVLSTVHAARAALVPVRLLDMKIEPYALSATLELIITQRLVRKLCNACKEEAAQPVSVFESEAGKSFEANGCGECLSTGYAGRVLIAECMYKTPEFYDALISSAGRGEFFRIAETQGRRLEALAIELLQNGDTSPAEIRRVLAGCNSL